VIDLAKAALKTETECEQQRQRDGTHARPESTDEHCGDKVGAPQQRRGERVIRQGREERHHTEWWCEHARRHVAHPAHIRDAGNENEESGNDTGKGLRHHRISTTSNGIGSSPRCHSTRSPVDLPWRGRCSDASRSRNH
jgi:hypothetical protein